MKPDWANEDVKDSKPVLTAKQIDRLMAMTKLLRDGGYCLDYVKDIKELLAAGNVWDAKAMWFDLTEEEQHTLWVAPKFGGIFTTKEREQIKSDEWSAA